MESSRRVQAFEGALNAAGLIAKGREAAVASPPIAPASQRCCRMVEEYRRASLAEIRSAGLLSAGTQEEGDPNMPKAA